MGVAGLAGIGFTVSLFIAGLAYPENPDLEAAARLGILAGSIVAGALGMLLLFAASKRNDAEQQEGRS